jgi:hypothetical protein
MPNITTRLIGRNTYRVVTYRRYLAQINILRGLTKDELSDLRWFIAVHGSYQRPFWKVVHYKTPYISKNPIIRHSTSREQRAPFYRIPLIARKEKIIPPSDHYRFVNEKAAAKVRKKTHRSRHSSLLNIVERCTPI